MNKHKQRALFSFSRLPKNIKTPSSSSSHPANFLRASLLLYPAYKSWWGRPVSPAAAEHCRCPQVINKKPAPAIRAARGAGGRDEWQALRTYK